MSIKHRNQQLKGHALAAVPCALDEEPVQTGAHATPVWKCSQEEIEPVQV